MPRKIYDSTSQYEGYIFDRCYREQLELILDNHIFSIKDCYEKRRLTIPGTETTQEVPALAIKVTINQDLFFKPCQLELIKQCLAHLEKNPESCRLFGDLSKYAKNSISGSTVLLGSMMILVSLILMGLVSALLAIFLPVIPFISITHPGLAMGVALLSTLGIAISGCFCVGGVFILSKALMRLVVRTRDLVKMNSEIANLKQIEQKLTALIKDDKIKETDEEAVNKQTKTCQLKQEIDLSQETEEVATEATKSYSLYPSLDRFFSSSSNGSALANYQDEASNTHDNQVEYRN